MDDVLTKRILRSPDTSLFSDDSCDVSISTRSNVHPVINRRYSIHSILNIINYIIIYILLFYIYNLDRKYDIPDKTVPCSKKHERVNMLSVEGGAELIYSECSAPYKYMYFFSFNDVNVLLGNNYSLCYAMDNKSRVLVFKVKKAEGCSFGIYHPMTDDRSSAIRYFTLYYYDGDEHTMCRNKKIIYKKLKRFEYKLDGGLLQKFSFDGVNMTRLKIVINDNWGNNKYTAVYRLFLY